MTKICQIYFQILGGSSKTQVVWQPFLLRHEAKIPQPLIPAESQTFYIGMN